MNTSTTRHLLPHLQGIASRIVLAIGLVAAVFGGVSNAWAAGGDTWQEEVLLHDGQKMVVERSQTYGGRYEMGQSMPAREHTIRFTLPNSSNAISWTSEYGEGLGRTNFNLLALHVKDKTPYVIAEPNLCLAYNHWGRPNPPYVIFKWEAKAWQQIGIAALPTEFSTINLIVNNSRIDEIKDNSKSTGYVPATYVQVMNGRLPQAQYRSILREPMATGLCPQYSASPKAPD
ncbi:hypothetical protein [Rhodoferax sp.]|uniref:hypothetical protein n=1 Tax=Rhodoferax sp. TaxID=50421 RepID=UPI0025CCA300|nr:hypothetical protein [Rhodoferax sp.]